MGDVVNDGRRLPRIEEGEAADIAIGWCAALTRDRLADRLLNFSRVAPDCSIGVHELTLTELLPAVRAGRVAVAVVPDDAPGGSGLSARTLWREEAMVAMSARHRLAASTRLAPEALLDTVTLLSCDRAESEMQRYLLGRLFAGVRPPLDARLGPAGDPMTRIATGDGVSLVLAGHPLPAGVVTRPIAAAEAVFEVRAWWRDDPSLPALATLLRLLAD